LPSKHEAERAGRILRPNDLLQLVRGKLSSADLNLPGVGSGGLVNLIAEYDGAARDADEKDVQAGADPGPQMDLE
jgi:hypothetical protein